MGAANPHFSPGGGMIAQGFGFTRDFLKERNNSAYCRLNKIPCVFKEQARARHPGEKCRLEVRNVPNSESRATVFSVSFGETAYSLWEKI
jgi:hypothetical protein